MMSGTDPHNTESEPSLDDDFQIVEVDKVKEEEQKKQIITDFHLLDKTPPPPLPDNFPKLYKYISEFTYLNKEKEDQERQNSLFLPSFHPTNTASYNGRKFWIKHCTPGKLTKPDELCDPKSCMPGLELCIWLWDRITAHNNVPNQGFLLLNHENQIVGIATEDIPGFKTNRSDPLLKEDLIIEALKKNLHHQRDRLIVALKKLTQQLNHYETNAEDGVLNQTWTNLKFYYHRYSQMWSADSASKSVPTNDFIQSFLEKDADFSRKRVGELIVKLSARQERVKELLAGIEKISKEHERYQQELIYLEEALKIAGELTKINPEDHIDLRELDEISRIVKKKNINLDTVEIVDEPLLSGKKFEIKSSDLIHIRYAEGNAICDVENWTGFENDDHNKNRNKKGDKIDGDMKEWWFVSHFKEINYVEMIKGYVDGMKEVADKALAWFGWNSNLNGDEFDYPENDIANLPEINESLKFFRYWRTKANTNSRSQSFPQTILQTVYGIFDISNLIAKFKENFYTSNDIIVSQSLKTNDMYNFYKYKQFLKKILVTETQYQHAFNLTLCNFKDNLYTNKKDYKEKKIAEFVAGKVARMKKLTERLINTPEFYPYLKEYGDYYLKTIKEDIENDLADDLKKAEEYKEPCFLELAKLYSFNNLDDVYQSVFKATTEAEKARQEKRTHSMTQKL